MPGPNVIKLFTAAIYKCSEYARVFVLGKPFPPRLMYVGKVRDYLSAALTMCSTLG